MKRILVARLSAMGDVALAVPAIHNVLEANPNLEIVMLTRNQFQVFFGSHPRLSFHPIDLKGKHKGLLGLKKLHSELKTYNFNSFIDLHDILRTKVLRTYFKFSKVPYFFIDKDRKTKKKLIQKEIPFTQQKHSTDRYLDVFRRANVSVTPNFEFVLKTTPSERIEDALNLKDKTHRRIGIAPFGAHDSKQWGIKNIKELLKKIQEDNTTQVFLFGGGAKEVEVLNALATEFDNATVLAGQFSFKEELFALSQCDVVLAMDSGNMHLADLVGSKVVSIWTSTHPYLGFYPLHNLKYCLFPSQEELPEFPVSVFGKISTDKHLVVVEKARKIITVDSVLKVLMTK